MFEILEDLWVLHSQINPEKDNSKVTIFKINLNKDIIFKTSNLEIKEYLSRLYLNNRFFCSLNNCMDLLNVFFVNLDAIKFIMNFQNEEIDYNKTLNKLKSLKEIHTKCGEKDQKYAKKRQ